MNIGVLGLWHLGLVNAVGLSFAGHNVIGLCEDEAELEHLLKGLTPVFSPSWMSYLGSYKFKKTYFFVEPQYILCLNVLIVAYDTPVNRQDRQIPIMLWREQKKQF